MKIVNYRCSGIYGLLGFHHTVLVSGGKVLSYELFPFGHGKYKVYNESNFRMGNISYIEEILGDEIDITAYENKKLKYIWCFEALDLVLKENNLKSNYYGDIKQ